MTISSPNGVGHTSGSSVPNPALMQPPSPLSGLVDAQINAHTPRASSHGGETSWRSDQQPCLLRSLSQGHHARQDNLQDSDASQNDFHDFLINRIRGGASEQQIQSFHQLLTKIEANPRTKALWRAMQAHHELLGQAPEIEFRARSGTSQPWPSENTITPIGRLPWYLDLDALNTASTDNLLQELAGVYNNMTGILHDRDPFAALIRYEKPPLDPKLEQAWQKWLTTHNDVAHRQAVTMLREQLREAQCYGGLDKQTFLQLLKNKVDERRLGLTINLSGKSLIAIPPMPDDVSTLDISTNGIKDWANLPCGLKILYASDTGGQEVLKHVPPGLIALSIARNNLTRLSTELLPRCLKFLDVSYNELSDLSGLPDTIETLHLRKNAFAKIPRPLPGQLKRLTLSLNQITIVQASDVPRSVEILDLSQNNLTVIEDLSTTGLKELTLDFNSTLTGIPVLPQTLYSLSAQYCGLQALFNSLPGQLVKLYIAHNRLQQLPRNLPATLRTLIVNDNQVARLPDDLHRLTSCVIDLRNNLLAPENIPTFPPDQPAPRIHFSMRALWQDEETAPAPTIAQAVRHWLGLDMIKVATDWDAISQKLASDPEDAHATAQFARFLEGLRTTVSYESQNFRTHVQAWLAELAKPERETLLKDSLQACVSSTRRCDDRVALVYNQLQKMRFHDGVRIGRYNKRISEAYDMMRQMFRLDQLEQIAYRKIESLGKVDDVEVYLAYVVKLRQKLQLSTVVPKMRYFEVSDVTQKDIDAAYDEVSKAERAHFYQYLVLDDTWNALLKQKLGKDYENAEQQLADQSGEPLQQKVLAELLKLGLNPNDTDAQSNIGITIWNKTRFDILEPLTKKLLTKHGVKLH